MRYFNLLILILLTGCTSNKEIIDYTNKNAKKLSATDRLNYTQTKNLIAIAKRLNNHKVLVAINPKDRESEVIISSCKIGKNNTQIEFVNNPNDNLPSWLDRYYIISNKEIKRGDRLVCKTNFEDLSINIF